MPARIIDELSPITFIRDAMVSLMGICFARETDTRLSGGEQEVNESNEPCVVSLLSVGAACRVTMDENREPKCLILSRAALVDAAAPLMAASGGISVTDMLIRF